MYDFSAKFLTIKFILTQGSAAFYEQQARFTDKSSSKARLIEKIPLRAIVFLKNFT